MLRREVYESMREKMSDCNKNRLIIVDFIYSATFHTQKNPFYSSVYSGNNNIFSVSYTTPFPEPVWGHHQRAEAQLVA